MGRTRLGFSQFTRQCRCEPGHAVLRDVVARASLDAADGDFLDEGIRYQNKRYIRVGRKEYPQRIEAWQSRHFQVRDDGVPMLAGERHSKLRAISNAAVRYLQSGVSKTFHDRPRVVFEVFDE